ncbi:MAG TPA: glycosyltransferase family 2 protein [Solirubrobacterales bacterium]|nr:glycosyltransferase family 2 protein [Solirubrobacterales bacterium]
MIVAADSPSNEVFLTIVIPAWDLDGALDECLASVDLDPEPCRVVVVDNASARPLRLGPRVQVVRTARRRTLAAARNLGLERVETELVCFLDGDDVLIPPALESLVDTMRGDPGLVLAAGSSLLWDPERDVVARSFVPPRRAFLYSRYRRWLAARQTIDRVIPTHGAVVQRTAALRAVGGFPDTAYGENWLLGVSLALAGGISLDSRPMKFYRVGPSHNRLSRRRDRDFRQGLRVRREMRETLRRDACSGRLLRLTSYWIAPLHLYLAARARWSRPRAERILDAEGSGIRRASYETLATVKQRTREMQPR